MNRPYLPTVFFGHGHRALPGLVALATDIAGHRDHHGRRGQPSRGHWAGLARGWLRGLSKKPPLCGPIGVLGLAWLSRARGCGMAMGVLRGQESTLQVAIVCLDELVPEDCRYRKLDRLVDWTFVREAASPYYADEVGRPSVDPIVLVKLLVAGALEGIGSARELCRVAGLRLDLRRFLGYGFHERLPAHQTLSHAQTRRFVDGALS